MLINAISAEHTTGCHTVHVLIHNIIHVGVQQNILTACMYIKSVVFISFLE